MLAICLEPLFSKRGSKKAAGGNLNSLKILAHFEGASAGHRAFGAFALNAGRTCSREEEGGNTFYKAEHFSSERTNLPLRTGAAAKLEKIVERAGVHSHNDAGIAGVGEDEAGVLVGFFAGGADGFLVGDGEGSGIAEADRAGEGVGFSAEFVGAGAEHFAGCTQLDVYFQTDYGFVFHN